ncbi:dTDP-glucose 4,6-dehydratase [Streptomyces kronopolitis]|uniref:dTDP-glucose 4,6-dehydratase n=1 Tax=Streptomyces kronopolitis TaxID=1612435 RepID=A0ABQ2J3R0_9ACTN|nr:dTDP-glucose 4,6-dehydratase [Streptomyces kronopolitis]GGN36564.1 dTDP-glucose 4,6-dehydratase [Streptomyces kronopolitis]
MYRAVPARTVLVTGAAGFIGANFVHYWRRTHADDTIIALDALTYAGNRESLAAVRDDVVFVQADIADGARMAEILREYRVQVVVNFAAESHNSLAVLDPGRFFRTNVLGTQTLLHASLDAGVDRFHHVSTCEVYGDLALDGMEVFHEGSPYRPRTPYNASKAGADHAVRAYHETFGLPVTITNCANNYGRYQFPEKVVPLFVTNALRGLSLPVYESRHNRREWIHVDDHCRAIDAVLTDGEPGMTYHVGTGVEVSVQQLADLILDELGLPTSLQTTVADRPGHDRRYLLDSSRIRETLGWQPTVAFEEGLRETIRWYRDNPGWWEPLLERRPVVEERAWSPSEAGAR